VNKDQKGKNGDDETRIASISQHVTFVIQVISAVLEMPIHQLRNRYSRERNGY
jgi:hypothetical protein